ncbi:hypothetical protein [Vibrio sinaloensis]|nr:hypothetical protein [Vibrio sinaloensis]UPQ88495.1 hypothetical protein MTO69_02815 [Vibrio sinaloensis]
MMKWLRLLIARYDAWCLSLGLTPEHKRSCVPYRSDHTPSSEKKAQK